MDDGSQELLCKHAYLVLKEPDLRARAMAGKSVDGLPDVAAGEVGFFDKFSWRAGHESIWACSSAG